MSCLRKQHPVKRFHVRTWLLGLTTCSLALIASGQTFATTTHISSEPLKDLKSVKWQHRVILLFATDNATDWKKRLLQNRADIDERDIVWFILEEKSMDHNYEQQVSSSLFHALKGRVKHEGNRVILIGKDGFTKHSSNTLDLDTLFSLIDTMPMRIQEMQTQQ